ncbi:TonB-dependent receptor [uncultured Algibacter sp.]|uniref:SusC/RagA family TonB-linked outer membrane protein n=1 Tax=uncultured Algibacter sp. TaxID=298659 RepID=UPI00261B971C|nr:TonB-dependent receptor [uncultured Algibacter sp.]
MKKTKLLFIALLFGFSFISWAQSTEVSGVVLDEQSIPLPGANIQEKGTTNGTVTDFDGNFTISVSSANAVLIISYVGYTTQEVALNGSSTYSIQLEVDAEGLDEIVVIGYGAVKKSDATGSVVSLDSEKLTEMKKTDVAEAIQGRMAGVDVRRVNSKPGAPLSIKIRGNTVISSSHVGKDGVSDNLGADPNGPLYVVDGIFVDDLSFINPSDIEKLDVLKDASATAIYGSRGANGVVIVTLKAGVEGKMQVTYDATFGVNSVVNEPDMYDGDQYVNFVNDVLRGEQWLGVVNGSGGTVTPADFSNIVIDTDNAFVDDNERNNVANRNYTNWRELLRKNNQLQTTHTVAMSGGGSGLVYNTSIGYTSDKGLMGIEGFERYNISAALTNKINDKFTAGVKAYFSMSDREGGSLELFRSSMRLAPTVNPYNADGTIKVLPDAQDERFINPLYEVNGSWTTQTRTTSFIANAFLQYQATPWLRLKTNFAPEFSNTRYGEYRGLLTKAARNDPSRTRSIYNTFYSRKYNWDNTADFNFDINDDNNLKATLIAAFSYEDNEGSDIQTRNVSSDLFDFYNTGAGSDIRGFNSFFSKETVASFATRINYSYKNKYLLTFTGRYDGASKLAKNHKWAFFPSAALAWKVSEEKFLQDVNWLSSLKLRVSYGESGNYNSVRPYDSQATLNQVDYLYGGAYALGNTIGNLVNNELTWERSKEFNVGVNASLFGGRARLEAEFYNKKTIDAILGRPLLGLVSFDASIGNYGSVRNKGIELALTTVNIDNGNFKWETSLNFAKNTNELLELDGDIDTQPYVRHGVRKIGESLNAMYSYEKLGIWQLDEVDEAADYGAVPGMYKFKDQNGDGEINEENDRVVIGSHDPDWIGGMTNNFSYKNWDFNVMVYTRQGVLGHSEFYQNFAPHQNDKAKFNKINLDYWTPTNTGAKYPLPGAALSNGDANEWYFEDMSFVKVGNIGMAYSFTPQVLEKLNLSTLRLSLDIKNPFIFTDYEGPDPETGLQNSYGMAYSTKSVIFGLKVKF